MTNMISTQVQYTDCDVLAAISAATMCVAAMVSTFEHVIVCVSSWQTALPAVRQKQDSALWQEFICLYMVNGKWTVFIALF